MRPPEANGRAVAILRLLGSKKRMEIVRELLAGEICVGTLADRVGLSQSALSQHLARFRAHDLVTVRRDAQSIFYSCADPDVQRVYEAAVGVGRDV